MANRQIDELLSLVAGMAVAKVTRVLTKKYVDTKANLNIASLKRAGIPSNYIHGVAGLGAGGYAVYQANKRGQLSEEEYFAAGFGTMALLDTVVDVIAPPTTTTTAASRTVRSFSGDVRIMPPQLIVSGQGELAPGEGNARMVL